MRALQLDYQQQRRYLPWPGLALLATAMAALGLLGSQYLDLVRFSDTAAARLDRLDRQSSRAVAAPPPLSAAAARAELLEVRQVSLVLRQLRMPWTHLFSAVEASAGKEVALLGMEPDSRSGTVKITGEAKHLDAVLDFVKHLADQAAFRSVFLQNHQVQEQNPQRPVRFTLLATWKVDTP